ncbi:ATP-binding protein [Gluconacetobacter takamatsuzukensis]|uniref:histidine kinase n=1 Tax=Gluconacetobacter takamatsuzukensis TaxID=1286190 RepID=A0A7W4KFW7_9PROT|nr:ATP-binding protein [Gluconacetobacter takamatsuzukensis]MBB2206148.1 two-component sensor histidine kinase [Gluconacetobacter takamatsuzukensis]
MAVGKGPGAARRRGMAGFYRRMDRPVRRVLPRSLLGRMLLIVLIPLLVTQGISLELFYGNYLKVVSRRMSGSVSADIVLTLDLLKRYESPEDRAWIMNQVRARTQLDMDWEPGQHLSRTGSTHVLGPMDDDLADALNNSIGRPYHVDWIDDPQTVHIHIQMPDGVLDVRTPRKRLSVAPIWLFVAWAVGSTLLLFVIASLFMRNQIRAIRRLARAAELFGLGRDIGPICPEGAQEVRKAAVAFNRMQERIFRFVAQRTAVLAGVSHDLRTPLTRLRLSLAMIPPQGTIDAAQFHAEVTDMVADVAEMEGMIESYLSFARGEGAETPVAVDVGQMLDEVASAFRRAGGSILSVSVPQPVEAVLRPGAIRRVLDNLLQNARRHDARVALSAGRDERGVVICVDDDGPGIPRDRMESVFRPFESGQNGGTGLGLTIARDIVRAHGGDIALRQSRRGGLQVRIVLPA